MKNSSPSFDKLRGGYYTPVAIADALATWAIRSGHDKVLEPSCGDGVFLESAARRFRSLGRAPREIVRKLTAVEIAGSEAEKAERALQAVLNTRAAADVRCADFFEARGQLAGKFDCVLGNPPFIRYQSFPEPSRSRAMNMMRSLGLRSNKLTNIWVPFVAASISCLREGGRLAMVLPAELLQVTYAGQLRSYLVDSFRTVLLVACNKMLFPRAEQEVLLVLAEGRVRLPSSTNKCRIDLVEVEDTTGLVQKIEEASCQRGRQKLIQHDSEKWLKYFLTAREISLMRRLRQSEQIVSLAAHASVDVGVVTGRNAFFVLSDAEARRHSLSAYTIPLVGRSSQLSGAQITKQEWGKLAGKDHRVLLLYVNGIHEANLPDPVRAYIKSGEERSFHKGYKCSIRRPWYSVPAVWAPDCFLFRQIYDFPRVVLNKAGAMCTDTIHRVSCRGDKATFASTAYTYLTAASAEIEGRSYGGGVLELEPTEAEKLLMPKEVGDGLPVREIDNLVREGALEEVLRENSRLILQGSVGMTKKECDALKRIWLKMRGRRSRRSRGK